MKLHHVGYACTDIGSAINFFKNKHDIKSINGPLFDPRQNAMICILNLKGQPNIELVSGSPVEHYINGENPIKYHNCYEVDNLEKAIHQFKKSGYTQVSEKVPAIIFDNRQVVFLKKKESLIELLESRKQNVKLQQNPTTTEINLASTFHTGYLFHGLERILTTLKIQQKAHFTNIKYINNGLMLLDNTFWEGNKLNIIITRLMDWCQFKNTENDKLESRLEEAVNDLSEKLLEISSLIHHNLTIILCPNTDLNKHTGIKCILEKYETKLISELDKAASITLITHEELQKNFSWHLSDKITNSYGLKQAHRPYSKKYEELIALGVAKQILRETSQTYKVIIVDCDDTLWSGVCGESKNISDIRITKEHIKLQQFLKDCAKRGYLICLCSKNIEADVTKVFKKHPDMVLSINDITAMKINWLSKADNLLTLSKQLNLQLESFIFMDNSFIECHEIQQLLPQVLTIHVPETTEDLADLTNALWVINNKKSVEALNRKNTYILAEKRNQATNNTKTPSSAIKKLKLRYTPIWISSNDTKNIIRASELSFRVTQFNCNGNKYSEANILSALNNGRRILQISLSDKFGEYGIVATTIINTEIDPDRLVVEDIFISCRAFYKGVEYRLIQLIGELAIRCNYDLIAIMCKKSSRNIPATQFIERLMNDGFALRISETECLIKANSALSVFQKNRLPQFTNKIDNTQTSLNIPETNQIRLIHKHFSTVSRLSQYLKPKNVATLDKSKLSESIIKLWQKHLNLTTPPKSTSHFFLEGGSSLDALELLSDLYNHLKITINFPSFLKSPSLASVLDHARKQQNHPMTNKSQQPKNNIATIEPIKRKATDNQQWLWINKKIDGHSWHYNLPFILNLNGKLNINRFKEALNILVKAHPMLRTIFFEEEETLFQEVQNDFALKLEVINVCHTTEDFVNNIINEKCYHEFTYNTSPLYQLTLIKINHQQWIFILNFHHIIFDATSLKVFLKQLSTLYNETDSISLQNIQNSADKTNTPSSLQTESEDGDNSVFWRAKLANVHPIILPYDFHPPETPNHKGFYLELTIEKNVYTNLKQLASKYGTSLQVVFISGIYLLLNHYGNNDTIIPISVDSRNHHNQDQIGFFSKVIPLRISPNKLDIKTLIDSCNSELVESLSKTIEPLHQLISKLETNRNGASNIFTKLLLTIFDEKYTQQPKLKDIEVSYYKHGYDAARMDLVIEVMPCHSGEARIGFYFSHQLFKVETGQDIISKFNDIIIKLSNEVIDTPAIQKKSRLLGKQSRVKRNQFIDRFHSIAKQSPHQTALFKHNSSLSYLELEQLIQKIINQILNYDSLERVIICLPRQFELIACYFACIQLKVTFVPIDPRMPLAWVNQIIKTVNASLVITTESLCKKYHFSKHSLAILECDKDQSSSQARHIGSCQQNNTAYILFTSGSTGIPKGVSISYDNLSNLINWAINSYQKEELHNVLFSTSVSFDLSIFEIFTPLSTGGSVTIVENALSIVDIPSLSVSLINLTPSTLAALLKKSVIPKSVTTVNLAGEMLNPLLIKNLYNLDHIKSVYNLYAPTETTTYSTHKLLTPNSQISIGYPINNTAIHIIDDSHSEVDIGKRGQIAIAGKGVSLGYINSSEHNSSFIKNTLSPELSETLYLTGDYGYITESDELQITGRKDQQIKIRGHRIELEQIRQCILLDDHIEDAVVVYHNTDQDGTTDLTVYFIRKKNQLEDNELIHSLKSHIANQLPYYMVPTHYKIIDKFPKLLSGKIDLSKLKNIKTNTLARKPAKDRLSHDSIATAWEKVLGHKEFSEFDNFFDVGGNSLLAIELHSLLCKENHRNIRIIDIFNHPTINAFRNFLNDNNNTIAKNETYHPHDNPINDTDIAIIGLALRLPGASTLQEYSEILEDGKVALQPLSDKRLKSINTDQRKMSSLNFVPVCGLIEKPYDFDNELFNFTAKEALNTDPQQRLFLEVSWEALQEAGTIPGKKTGKFGVFAGCGVNEYGLKQLLSTNDPMEKMQWHLGNEKDYLATKVAYKLNLNGPAININTACSTGLSAFTTACQHLQSGLVDIAIAGASTLILPEDAGYIYNPNYIYSQNGACMPFDDEASGIVPSSGVIAIVLKRMNEAIADSDTILGVVKGFSINNDGRQKTGFTAPSALSQANCLEEALNRAQIDSSQVHYIETHGTGTAIGDPIEIEGIKLAYKNTKNCALGSVKANIGHTDTAAGLASLAKVIAMYKHKKIFPQPNFCNLNKRISLEENTFYINRDKESIDTNTDFYTGISSFGIGGTNVHVILKNHIKNRKESNKNIIDKPAVFLLSAKSLANLEAMKQQLITTIKQNKNKKDILHRAGYTLAHHRFDYHYRYICVAKTFEEAIYFLSQKSTKSTIESYDNNILLQTWLSGKTIDASLIYPKGIFEPITLPYYPMKKREFNHSNNHYHNNDTKHKNTNNTTSYDTQLITDKLLIIYRELLGTENIKITDSFFNLGGDSLLLLRLLSKIKSTWNVELNFDEAFEHDSITEISKLIKDNTLGSQHISFERMQTGDNENDIVLVFIHPGNGALFQYQPLVKQLQLSNPIYGINNNMPIDSIKSMSNIENYAELYSNVIRTHLPNKQVILIGWSFGGTVAYEIARQTENDEHNFIHSVLLLDSWAKYPKSFDQTSVFESFMKQGGCNPDTPEASLLIDILKIRMKQLLAYEVKPINITPIKLFKASETLESNSIKSNYWDQFVKNISVINVNGCHNTMLNEKYLATLEKVLSQTINSTEAMINE